MKKIIGNQLSKYKNKSIVDLHKFKIRNQKSEIKTVKINERKFT